VKGRLMCLGSPDHLKNKFGNKYYLAVNADMSNMSQVEEFLKSLFPNSDLKLADAFASGASRKYEVTRPDSLAAVFRALEENKAKLKISEYSLSQTTLEQVFLHFAHLQEQDFRPVDAPWAFEPQKATCPHCQKVVETDVTYVSGGGNMTMAQMFGCGNLGKSKSKRSKDAVHQCPRCKKELGRAFRKRKGESTPVPTSQSPKPARTDSDEEDDVEEGNGAPVAFGKEEEANVRLP